MCKRIKQQASKERKTDLQEGIGTEEDFKNLYGWFIDAMFQKLPNCNKEEGTLRELKRFSIIRDKLQSYRQGLQELNRIQQSTAVLVQSTNRNPSSTGSTITTSSGSSTKY